MEIKEAKNFQSIHDFIQGEGVNISQKRYKDIQSIYAKVDTSLAEDTLMYEVYTLEEDQPSLGSLCWGLSVLYPVSVCGECNMTRGHYHCDPTCNEFYYGASGEGLLLLTDENGNTYAETVKEGSLHHILGYQAHRLVNTGNTPLKVICAWSSQAGHDYQRMEREPFSARIFKEEGKLVIKDLTQKD